MPLAGATSCIRSSIIPSGRKSMRAGINSARSSVPPPSRCTALFGHAIVRRPEPHRQMDPFPIRTSPSRTPN